MSIVIEARYGADGLRDLDLFVERAGIEFVPVDVEQGKVARLDYARARLRADLQAKRTLLRTVLQAEKYEEAARLRDEIRSLETGLYVSETGAD